MSMSRDEIFAKIRDEVLVEALGVDEDEISMDASLTRDLEAESIDFLDIQFKLERAFSTDDRPFKIEQGELFPENLLENADWVADGKFTDAGMAMLRERMPHVSFDEFDGDRSVNEVGGLITVGSIVSFVERKLAAGEPAGA
jgi:acyl carrier protein